MEMGQAGTEKENEKKNASQADERMMIRSIDATIREF
jgi:hypothetical protein